MENTSVSVDNEFRLGKEFRHNIELIKGIKIPNINYKFEILNRSSIVTSTSEGKIKIISNL